MKHEKLYDLEKDSNYVLLGNLDEGQDYEVDQTLIFWCKLDNKFYFITASGCSCWDGDFQYQVFNTLDEIKKIYNTDVRGKYTYNPSVNGLNRLLEEVESNIITHILNVKNSEV